MFVLRQPEIEITVGIQTDDGLTEKSLQSSEKVVHLGKFLPRISEEIFDCEVGMVLAHKHGQCRTIAPTGKSKHMSLAKRHDVCSISTLPTCARAASRTSGLTGVSAKRPCSARASSNTLGRSRSLISNPRAF